jgi:hypothetical protein
MIKHVYDVVMDPDTNPLRRLPKIVRFQIMTYLAMMWSITFSVWIGSLQLFGPSMLVHAILLVGVYFTNDAFRRVRRVVPLDHRSKYRDTKDGCARYDDIWGG